MSHRLDEIQRWMQAVITHAGGIVPGIESPQARGEIDVDTARVEEVIARSEALSSVERLGVYGNAYFARLLECMGESFPCLVQALGEETFDEFAFGYLQTYPSTSYTLNHLADRFPDYLRETRPDTGELGGGEVGWPDFIIDLATLELTFEKVFDGPGFEHASILEADDLAAVAPEVWPQVRLRPVPCLRLLAFHFPVNAYFTAFRREEEPEIPGPHREFVAITRRDYVVRRFNLSPAQFALLGKLIEGAQVGEAIEAAAEAFTGTVEELADGLRQWFGEWAAAGFFESLELPD
ncbi:MAG: DUF2063 domain-containing protein [Planctomycetota bacterium]|nr:MAG: DUF2063 domain-containing protein [Planctomycetota bacterium]REK46513.1 MAG: DUF2063 domain-containing protein [Planctomycetota bacterium]